MGGGVIREFEHDQTRAGPVALKRDPRAAAHDVGAAMPGDQRRDLRLVGLVALGIVYIHRRDQIAAR